MPKLDTWNLEPDTCSDRHRLRQVSRLIDVSALLDRREMGEEKGAHAAMKAFNRLVRASGIKVSLRGDGIELNPPDLLAQRMASPANMPMRNATAQDISDDGSLMLAQRVYALS
jgi:hypothetical protein